MSKIQQNKFNADLVVPRDHTKSKYVLTRLNDGLTKTGDRIQYIEWDEKETWKESHDNIKVGRSLLLNPRMDYTWLTTSITEIVEQRQGYVKFKTQNSDYVLTEM